MFELVLYDKQSPFLRIRSGSQAGTRTFRSADARRTGCCVEFPRGPGIVASWRG
jgi:hypothetical protein